MSSEPELQTSLENIQRRLAESPLDADSAADCAHDLSELGKAVTAAVEAEFSVLVDPAKTSAA